MFKLRTGLTHPDYTGDPFTSPDVGLFTSAEVLPAELPIATESELESLDLADVLLLTGFPGDVDQFFPIIPNLTVPQATNLKGTITALRAHGQDEVVTPESVDVIQHQAPTTPGDQWFTTSALRESGGGKQCRHGQAGSQS